MIVKKNRPWNDFFLTAAYSLSHDGKVVEKVFHNEEFCIDCKFLLACAYDSVIRLPR